MSQTLVVELSDEAFAAIQRQAEQAHVSPTHVAADSLEQHFGRPASMRQRARIKTDVELQAARERFERHFGAVDIGYATGTDNESIDADLAGEYAGGRATE